MAVTEADVKALVETGLAENEITPHLATARVIVSERIPAAVYSADRLDLIIAHLAAVLVSIRDPRITSEDVDGTTRTFLQPTGLFGTPIGQALAMLDDQHFLATTGRTMSFEATGMPRTDEQLATFDALWLTSAPLPEQGGRSGF